MGLTIGLQNCSLCNISTVTWLWWMAHDYNIASSSNCHVQLSLPVSQKKTRWGSWQERSQIVPIDFSPEESHYGAPWPAVLICCPYWTTHAPQCLPAALACLPVILSTRPWPSPAHPELSPGSPHSMRPQQLPPLILV